eukprot:6186703-Pleurochrysis_carterae.AAC.3
MLTRICRWLSDCLILGVVRSCLLERPGLVGASLGRCVRHARVCHDPLSPDALDNLVLHRALAHGAARIVSLARPICGGGDVR